MVCALGLGAHLVGRTRFCIHPADELNGVPRLGGTKQLDEQALLALNPTHLIVNKDENDVALVGRLAQHIPHVLVTHPVRVEDNLALFEQFAQAFGTIDGVTARAANLAARLREAMQANLEAGTRLPPERVLYLIWKNPWMSVASNTYIAHMLATVGWQAAIGGRDPAADTAEVGASRYPVVEQAQLLDGQYRRILLSSEPYRFKSRHVLELQGLLDDRPAALCSAHLVDGEMCSWYGPRAIRGLHYLRQFRQTLATSS